MNSDEMGGFLAQLPKAELHLHIEGTISPQTALILAKRNQIDFPYRSVEAILTALANREAGLKAFLDHYYLMDSLMQSGADFYEVTYELLRACRQKQYRLC